MKILNIHVYSDPVDNGIRIRLDAIGLVREEIKLEPELERLGNEMFHLITRVEMQELRKEGLILNDQDAEKVITNMRYNNYFSPIELKAKLISVIPALVNPEHKKTIIDILNFSDKGLVKAVFKPEDHPMLYYRQDENSLQLCEKEGATHQQHSVIYTLASTPHAALLLMLALTNVVNNVMRYDGIYFNANYSEEGLSQTAVELGKNHGNDFMVTLFSQILALPQTLLYYLTRKDLEAITKPYSLYRGTPQQVGIVDLLATKSCCELLWKSYIDAMLSPVLPDLEKGQLFWEMEQHYKRLGAENEFDYILRRTEYLPIPKVQKSNNHSFFAKPSGDEIQESKEKQFII